MSEKFYRGKEPCILNHENIHLKNLAFVLECKIDLVCDREFCLSEDLFTYL